LGPQSQKKVRLGDQKKEGKESFRLEGKVGRKAGPEGVKPRREGKKERDRHGCMLNPTLSSTVERGRER